MDLQGVIVDLRVTIEGTPINISARPSEDQWLALYTNLHTGDTVYLPFPELDDVVAGAAKIAKASVIE